jgi:signal transduction histidine kinase
MRLTRSIDSMRRQLEGRHFVETFAADLSHELKNPVAAIRASAEVLEESALEEPEQARRFVSRIREAAARIERLLGELLGLAHIEARGAEQFEPVDLHQLAEQSARALDESLQRVVVHERGEGRVRGDPDWLARALGNLISNALVHSEPGSPVEVEVDRFDDDVVVTVTSVGSVPRHVRNRLFRRFVTTRADRGGTGLGLAIVRAVAEAHGGRVELADGGPPRVEFALTLPSARSQTAEPPAPADPSELPASEPGPADTESTSDGRP